METKGLRGRSLINVPEKTPQSYVSHSFLVTRSSLVSDWMTGDHASLEEFTASCSPSWGMRWIVRYVVG